MRPLAQAERQAAGGGRGRGGAPGGPGGAPRAGGPPAGAPPAAGAPAAAPAAPAEPPPLPTLAELRARPADQVLNMGGGQPVIDGYVIPEDLSITFANGKQNPVDVIVGFNKDEHLAFGGPTNTNTQMRDGMAWHMRLFAEAQTKIGRKAYAYIFTHEPPYEPGTPNVRATHASEIAYAFNNIHALRSFPDSSSPKLAMASEKDRAVANQMSDYWTNFAKKGDPNGPGLPQWPAFKDRNVPAHAIGESKDGPSVETLNGFDAGYAKILATLGVK
jgi:carboxylesterase type B